MRKNIVQHRHQQHMKPRHIYYGEASWLAELLYPLFNFKWFQFVHCLFHHFRLIHVGVLNYKLGS